MQTSFTLHFVTTVSHETPTISRWSFMETIIFAKFPPKTRGYFVGCNKLQTGFPFPDFKAFSLAPLGYEVDATFTSEAFLIVSVFVAWLVGFNLILDNNQSIVQTISVWIISHLTLVLEKPVPVCLLLRCQVAYDGVWSLGVFFMRCLFERTS